MITTEQIRVKLIEAIKLSGMTEIAIAQKIGVVQQSVAQYVSGKAMPGLDTFANLCKVLDLDVYDILCIND